MISFCSIKNYPRCLCVLLLLPSFSFAQTFTLSGTINDNLNSENIVSVTVELIESRTQKSYLTSSNEYGYYSLVIPQGSYVVAVSHLSYEALIDTLDFNQNIIRDYSLNRLSEQLDEVIVQGVAKRISNTEVSSHEMIVAEIKKLPVVLGEPDILKVILFLPGVNNAGESSIGFNVRGGRADQNLILLDEAPLFNPSHVFGLFSAFNSDAISSFKLYKGGIPARYGGRLSSVLDVRQYEGNKKGYELGGAIGIISAQLSAQGPVVKKKNQTIANNSFFIAARRSYFDLFTGLSSDETLQNTVLYFYDVNAKINWKLNKNNHLFLSTYFGQDQFGLSDIFTFGWGNLTTTLRWNHIYNQKIFSNISAVYSNYDYSLGTDLSGREFTWAGAINNFFLKGSWDYKHNNNNTFIVGFISNYVKTNPGEITARSTSSSVQELKTAVEFGLESAVYGEWVKKIGQKLRLHGGFRLNWFARFGDKEENIYENNRPVVYLPSLNSYTRGKVVNTKSYAMGDIYYNHINLSPRLNATYIINNLLSLKASYNRMYQYMQLLTNNSTVIPTDIYRLAGTYIKPSIANQITIGLFSNIPFKGRYIQASMESFYKTFEDVTDYIDGANLLFNPHIETELLNSSGLAYGVEFMIEKRWGKLTGWLSYTYSSSTYQGFDNQLGGQGVNKGKRYSSDFDLPHNLSLVGTYEFSKRLSASFSFVYHTGKPTTYPISKYTYNNSVAVFYGDRNAHRFEDYHRLDLSVTFKGKKRKRFNHEWVLSIYNVYNRTNAFSYRYTDRVDNSPSSSADRRRAKIPQSQVEQLSIYGIVPSVSWRFTFK